MEGYESSARQFLPEATVVAVDGELGRLVRFRGDDPLPDDVLTVALTGSGREVEVPMAVVDLAASSVDRVLLTVPIATITGDDPATTTRGGAVEDRLDTAGETLTVPVMEEELSARIRERDLGSVRVEKRVETSPAQVTTDVGHEEVTVERVTVNQAVESAPESRFEGDTLVIPVVEEVLVTEKRLVVREEVHIRRRWVTESVTVEDTVRREVLDIEERATEDG